MPYEIRGDDLLGEEILGAAPRRLAPMPGVPGGQLKVREPNRAREYPLGFDSVATIAAAASLAVSSRPQVVFRPDRLVIPASIAPNFTLTDIKIGKNSQLVGSSVLPAEVFSQTAVGVRLKLDTAQISQDIVLTVTNISGGAVRFMACLIGPAVE